MVPQLGSLACSDGWPPSWCWVVPRTQEERPLNRPDLHEELRCRRSRARQSSSLHACPPPTQAGLPLGVGHYKMALRACTRDRRWEAASALLHRVPPDMWEADVALCRNGLKACADAAEPQLAARLVAVLGKSGAGTGGGLGPDEYAWWLQACRVAGDADAASEAWTAYLASGGAPSELCYALRLGILYDLGEDDAALALGREAVAALPAENAQLVANAAVGCAVSNANYAVSTAADDSAAIVTGVARAREAMALRRACGAPPMAGAQVRVLQVCLAASEWAALVDELGMAQAAGYAAAMTEDELRVLRRVCEQTEQATTAEGAAEGAAERAAEAEGSAAVAVAALRTFVTTSEVESAAAAAAVAASGSKVARGGSRGPKHLSPDAKAAARRYSRSIALPGDDEALVLEPLHIVHEDASLLVLNKPINVSVHPKHRFESGAMLNRAVAHLGRPPYVVHRLDAPTSGLLVFAKTLPAARHLARQFKQRELSKQYLAALLGGGTDDHFEVAAPIARHPTQKTLSVVVVPPEAAGGAAVAAAAAVEAAVEAAAAEAAAAVRGEAQQEEVEGGKPSLTRFEVLSRGPAAALVAARPLTGRMHQIRVHAEHAGCPIAGDPQYGAAAQRRAAEAGGAACGRLMLHAHTLTLRHPEGNNTVRRPSDSGCSPTCCRMQPHMSQAAAPETLT